MRVIIIFFAILVVLAGCSKETANLEKKAAANKANKISFKMESPENPRNPADSIGIIHNKALHYVYKSLVAQENFSTDLKRKYTVEFFEQRYGRKLLRSIEERQSKNLPFKKIPIIKLTGYFPCSKILAQSVNDILIAAYQMRAPNDYPEFKRKVISMEQSVLDGKIKMSRTEADQFLHFCSVIRHSMWFWIDAIAQDKELNDAEFLRRFLRGILGGLADAHGALVSLFTYMSFRYVLEDAALDSAMMLWAFDS